MWSFIYSSIHSFVRLLFVVSVYYLSSRQSASRYKFIHSTCHCYFNNTYTHSKKNKNNDTHARAHTHTNIYARVYCHVRKGHHERNILLAARTHHHTKVAFCVIALPTFCESKKKSRVMGHVCLFIFLLYFFSRFKFLDVVSLV